jgi:twitching motility protein PilT
MSDEIVPEFNGWLEELMGGHGSDLHVKVGSAPLLRLPQGLERIDRDPLTAIETQVIADQIIPEDRKVLLRDKGEVDFAYSVPHVGRFRANVFRQRGSISMVLRKLRFGGPSFEEVGLPDVIRTLADEHRGLILVTGPTGSGKTTTLAAMIDYINKTKPVHIVTIEDPIEILLESDRAQVSQRQVGTHTPSFADALRSTLREDPDVIAVGELRDAESVATAVSAAETGHLVFGTLHTASAHRTIVRLLDQFPPSKRAHIRSMLATSLRAVVCQQLVPNADGRGRSLASEILVVNAAASNLIREDRVWQIPMVMQTGAAEGMRLMDEALLELVRAKRIGLGDALARATDRDRFLGR